jgi:hypothetical protein
MSNDWSFKISSGNLVGSLIKEAQTPAPAAAGGAAPAAPAAGGTAQPSGGQQQQAVEIPNESMQALQTIKGTLTQLNDLIAKLEDASGKQPTLMTAIMPGVDILAKTLGAGFNVNSVHKIINQGKQLAKNIVVVAKNPTALQGQNAQKVVAEVIAQWDAFDGKFGWFGGFKGEGDMAKFVGKPLSELHKDLKDPMGELKKATGK